jgi:hypothetical protein
MTSHFKVGQRATYTKGDVSVDVTIMDIDLSDGEPFYTIKGDFGNDRSDEKQTISQYLCAAVVQNDVRETKLKTLEEDFDTAMLVHFAHNFLLAPQNNFIFL